MSSHVRSSNIKLEIWWFVPNFHENQISKIGKSKFQINKNFLIIIFENLNIKLSIRCTTFNIEWSQIYLILFSKPNNEPKNKVSHTFLGTSNRNLIVWRLTSQLSKSDPPIWDFLFNFKKQFLLIWSLDFPIFEIWFW